MKVQYYTQHEFHVDSLCTLGASERQVTPQAP